MAPNLIAKTTIYTICCFKNVGVPGTPHVFVSVLCIVDTVIKSEIHSLFDLYRIYKIFRKVFFFSLEYLPVSIANECGLILNFVNLFLSSLGMLKLVPICLKNQNVLWKFTGI